MAVNRETKIKKQFDVHGREIVAHIKKNSLQNAQNFIKEVDKLTDKIEKSPKAFPPEPYLFTKNNLYRYAIIMKSWKIIFKLSNKLLVFIGIIHTSRHPREIKKLRTKKYD